VATAWDARYAKGPLFHGAPPPPFFHPHLGAGALVLELGCGAGKGLRALRGAEPSWRVVGLDASVPGLLRAREVAPVARGEAACLPFREGALDAVRIHFLLGHLDDAARVACASEVERVLRPGGWLEVREFGRGDLRDGTGRATGANAFERGGVVTRYFERGEVRGLFFSCDAEERVIERAVRFDARPRRVVELRARKLSRAGRA
jgi:SAM-dependent methyltransferase